MISSLGGRRGSPHRRHSNGSGGTGNGGSGGGGSGGGNGSCSCGIVPRDKMSRFVFLSVLIVAYSGFTIGLILWNSSGAATRSSGGSMTEEGERRANLASPTGGQSEARTRTPGGGGWTWRGDGPAGVDGEPATGREFPGDSGLEPEAAGLGKEQLGGAAVYAGIAHAQGAGGAAADGAQNFGREDWRGSLGLGGEGNAGGISGSNFGGAVTRPKAAKLAGAAPPTSPPLDQPFDVTLVSQTSQNRFWMLPFLCKRWPGPISIAILEEDKEALPEELCSRMVISATAAQTPEELDPVWYPVNRLRNVAVNAVKTSHFLMTDIDIWPDVNAYQALHMRFRLETERMEDAHSAIVFSAFSRRRFCEEEDCLEYANDVPETISDLKPCLETNTCGRFDAANQSGQGTAYVYYWRSMLRQPNQRTLEHILCFKSHRFEPYLVVRKTPLLPKFDERFLGYGKNKIQWINHLRYSGFSFYVMPVNFVIHAPHPKSVAKTSWERTGGGKQGKGNKLMDQTFETFMAELREEKGPEEDTVTSLCQKDRPPVGKKPSQFKKRSSTPKV